MQPALTAAVEPRSTGKPLQLHKYLFGGLQRCFASQPSRSVQCFIGRSLGYSSVSTCMTYAGCLPSTSASNVATTRTSDLIRPLRQFSAVADDISAEESGLQLLLTHKQLRFEAGHHQSESCTACIAPVAGGAVHSHFLQNGIQCSFATGKLAPLSDGSCLVKCGKTWVLASVSCTEGFRMRERTRPNLTVSAKLWYIPNFDASHVCCVSPNAKPNGNDGRTAQLQVWLN